MKRNRSKSPTHRIYEQLYYRLGLSPDNKKIYKNQIGGWKGELNLDTHSVKLPPDFLVLNDLRIKESNTDYQIDATMIFGDTIHVYEVKNFSGDYIYRPDIFRSQTGLKIANPAGQLSKWTALISNLCRKAGYRFEVKGFVIFINPEFFLYGTPVAEPFLFSGQLPSHFKSMEQQLFVNGRKQMRMAEKLLDLHDENYRPPNLPDYEYDNLTKGALCPECFSFEHQDSRQIRCCAKCGHKETIEEAIKRSIEEIFLLFPEKLVTKQLVYDWLNQEYSLQRIRRVLEKYFCMHAHNRGTYYNRR